MGLLLRLLFLRLKVARNRLLTFFQFIDLYFLCVMYFLVGTNSFLLRFCLYIYMFGINEGFAHLKFINKDTLNFSVRQFT